MVMFACPEFRVRGNDRFLAAEHSLLLTSIDLATCLLVGKGKFLADSVQSILRDWPRSHKHWPGKSYSVFGLRGVRCTLAALVRMACIACLSSVWCDHIFPIVMMDLGWKAAQPRPCAVDRCNEKFGSPTIHMLPGRVVGSRILPMSADDRRRNGLAKRDAVASCEDQSCRHQRDW